MARSIDPAAIPRNVRFIADKLAEHGFGAWVVGGCVRDLLMGRTVGDWDLCTSAEPNDVVRIFRRTIPTGIQHGTVTVLLSGETYEVTTLRGEGAYSDGRRPDSVHFVGTIEEDLARRDFTVNAIAWDPRTGALVDPWGGLADLDARMIRAVRDPVERFAEDGLRALRAARFVSTLEMDLDPATEAAIPGALATFAKVSAERVATEWEKACKAVRPSRAFAVMRRTGMLGVAAPWTKAIDEAAFGVGLARMDLAAAGLGQRFGALVMGAPVERAVLDASLRDLRFSNPDRERVLLLQAEAGLVLRSDMAGPARRRLLARLGPEATLAVLDAQSADARARGAVDEAAALLPVLEADLEGGAALRTKDLAVTGHDLMRELALPPGREIGRLMDALLDAVLDEPSLNARDALLARARMLRT
jgi:tRNA nucleotidyltransferase (CCA-adding enzyme)